MDVVTPSKPPAKDQTVPLLLFAAVGVILFICLSALFVYINTKHLEASRDWRDHSQDVLSTLQSTAQRLDRIDYTSRLYLSEKNAADLQTVQSTTVVLETGLVHLEDLVHDNPPQLSRARAVHACVEELMQQVNEALPKDTTPSRKILQCRENVGRMQEEERILLAKRTEESRHNTYSSLISGAGFLVTALVVVVTLFAFLLRDARKRQRIEKQVAETNNQLGATVRTLEKRAMEASLLMSARGELQLCTNPAQAHRAAVLYCKRLLPDANIALLIINNSRQMVEIAASSENEKKILDGFPLDACCGLRSGRFRWRRSGGSEVHCNHFLGTAPENYLCMPLAAHGDTLGVLFVEYPSPSASAELEEELESLQQLVEMSAMSIAGLNLRVRLEHQSIRDGLTNLFNRHFMEISLDREVRRAARNRTELAIFMLDVDHFKAFNDTFGHEAGDTVLREVAEVLRQSVRSEDIVCRYGGEEFVIIMPETSKEEAFDRAESIRLRIAGIRLRFRGEALREVNISIGVAVYPHTGNTLEEMLRAADRALYAAKHHGRNQTILANEVLANA